MKLMVVDNYKSFSLVPYLVKKLPPGSVAEMGNVYTANMWQIFVNHAPDVVFVDFADQNAQIISTKISELPKRPKLIVRLHGFESDDAWLSKVNWNAVDDLIVVSPMFESMLREKIGKLTRVNLVCNGVDLKRFAGQSVDDMNSAAGAYLGYLNFKKGLSLLRTVIESTPQITWHVGGVIQGEKPTVYMTDRPIKNLMWAGWVRPEMHLRGKRWIISTSYTESFGMSIAEGMAMGLTPLIHAWPGADKLWPRSQIWSTFQELEHLLVDPKSPEWCREWIEERYPIAVTIDKVLGLIVS